MSNRSDCRVLIVDDNKDAADSLAMVLEAVGFHVSVALSGMEALMSTGGTPPDAAVLDIGMPFMDGYELARRMRAQWPNVVLVAHTGWGAARDVERARNAGFHYHFTKPADAGVIAKILDSTCLGGPALSAVGQGQSLKA